MTSAVENEIVSMKLDNTQFEKAASVSIGTLAKLKSALSFKGADSGLSNIAASTRGFNMNPLIDSASGVAKAFSSMSVIAVSAIATIASQATQTGLGIANSLTLAPIMGGFSEYETQMGSIQTIMSNTGLEGSKGLDKVNGTLEELNAYSDKTIYNFSEMARNIGTFTAAGVNIDTSTDAIKGIANLAAVSGSNSQQASTAMYQLSQALASGKVSLMDWNSVVNAGMGGKVFKDSLMETARVHGVAIDDMIAKDGSFRDTLQNGWLSSEILTDTLAKFTGDLTDEQLRQQGYSAKQIADIQKLGQMSNDAATKVKTMTQLMGTLKEAVGSGWAKTWQLVFGDFNEARDLFTGVSDVLGKVIGDSAKQRNEMLGDWKELGGRTKLISAIGNAWKALLSILGPIKDAFRDIFPATTGKKLFEITKNLNQFFRSLRLTGEAQENLKRTFAGLFAVIHIGVSIITGIVKIIGRLLGILVKGQGSTLAFTGNIGDMLVALDKFLTGGGRMEKFFEVIGNMLAGILQPLIHLRDALIGVFTGLLSGDPSAAFDSLKDGILVVLNFLDMLSAKVATAFNSVSSAFGGIGKIKGFNLSSLLGGGGDAGGAAAKGIGAIKDGLGSVSGAGDAAKSTWQKVLSIFQSIGSYVGGLGDKIKGAFSGAAGAAGGAASGLTSGLGATFGPLLDQAKTVIDEIKKAFSNMSEGLDFTDVVGAIQTGLFLAIFLQVKKFMESITSISDSASGVLNQLTGNLQAMQANIKAQTIFIIAAALVLLAGAVYLLAQTDPKSLGVALGAVVAMLAAVTVAMKVLDSALTDTGSGKIIAIAIGIAILAAALALMAAAVFLFSRMSADDLTKGLASVAVALAFLTAAAAGLSKGGAGANMIGAAAGLLIMSFALIALLGAIKVYSKVSPETLTDGLVKIGAALVVLAAGMFLMQGTVGGATAMLIISAGLIVLAEALKRFNELNGDELKKTIFAVAAVLGVLAIAMALMSGGLAGAAALMIMAAALTVLVPVMIALGNLSWETIGKGLAVMVGAMLALGLAGAVIAPIVPILVSLATAVALLGAAVFLAGAGVALFATGLALLATNGNAGFAVFLQIIDQFIAKLPSIIDGFGTVIDSLVKLIGQKTPMLVQAFTNLIGEMVNATTKNIPKFGRLLAKLIETGIRVLSSNFNNFADAGMDLIQALIDEADRHVDEISDTAGDLAAKFIRAVGRQANKLGEAGADATVDIIQGTADAVNNNSDRINEAMGNLAEALIKALVSLIGTMHGRVATALVDLVKTAARGIDVSSIANSVLPGSPFGKKAEQVLEGIFKSLIGGSEQVASTLADIKTKIKDVLSEAKDGVKKYDDQIKDLKEKKQTEERVKQINKLRKARKEEKAELKDAKKSLKEYNKEMAAEGGKLKAQAALYDSENAKLAAAIDGPGGLKEWQAKIQGINDQINQTFNVRPQVDPTTSLRQYMREIEKQTQKVAKFKATLAILQSQGLNADAYKFFLSEGTDAQKLMDQLAAGGAPAVAAFQQANAGLTSMSDGLAAMANSDLGYTAGEATAQGIVKALQDNIAVIEQTMHDIALRMQKAIRKGLQIRSPSKKMYAIGEYAALGIINSLKDSKNAVGQASAAIGDEAMSTLQSTMSKLGDVAKAQINMNPTITPVLDLNQLTQEANKISGLIPDAPFNASMSLAYARDISAERRAAAAAESYAGSSDESKEITFIQNNTSPVALDDKTIYRNSKNLLSLAKGALNVT